MANLSDVLRLGSAAKNGPSIPFNARSALIWLDIPGAALVSGPSRTLTEAELTALATAMWRKLDGGREFTWSSFLLGNAIKAFAEASQTTPETLLKVLWELLESRPMNQNVFNLLEAVSIQIRGAGFLNHPNWDLEWLLHPNSATQDCVQYWFIWLREGLEERLPPDDPVPNRMQRYR